MNQHELLTKIETLIEESKVGLLATTDEKDKPRVRWMTPTIMPNRGSSIFAFTASDAMKIQDIHYQPEVKWLIQTADLTEVVSARGETYIVNNPALKAEVMEILIPQTTKLWTPDLYAVETVILETVIREATYYRPRESFEETIIFKSGIRA
jgi:general stress protein 26